MNLRTLAIILLSGQIFSAVFILLVLMRQLALFRLQVQPGLKWFRVVLFFLALTIFIGNLIPILIDILTIRTPGIRVVHHTNLIGVLYAASNTFVATASALLIWIMYRLAAKTILIVEHDKDIVESTKNNQSARVQ